MGLFFIIIIIELFVVILGSSARDRTPLSYWKEQTDLKVMAAIYVTVSTHPITGLFAFNPVNRLKKISTFCTNLNTLGQFITGIPANKSDYSKNKDIQ